MDLRAILNLLQQELIASLGNTRDVFETTSTITLFHRDDSLCYLNQTLPIGEVTADDLHTLTEECSRRNRTPFFEFTAELWPQAVLLLKEHGYEQILDGKTMVHDHSKPAPSPDAIVPGFDQIYEFFQVGGEAFGHFVELSETAVSDFKKRLDNKEQWASAVLEEDRIVAVGTATGTRSAAEVAGIGTLASHRRKGFGSQVVNHLVSQYYRDGGEVAWLSVAEAELVRFYEQLGFSVVSSAVGFAARS